MNSPLFCVNDIAVVAKNNREEIKKQRRDNYTYHTRLLNNIVPFKKKNMKQMKKEKIQYPKNDMYLQLKYYSAYAKSPIVNEEIVLINNSQQEINQFQLINSNLESLREELIDESLDEFYFDQNTPLSPNENNASGIKLFIKIFLCLSSNNIDGA